MKGQARRLWRGYSNSSYCHSVLSSFPVYHRCGHSLGVRCSNRSRSSSRLDGLASVWQRGCCGQIGFGTYVWITRPHEDRCSGEAVSMPPHARHLAQVIRESDRDEIDDSTYWGFHRHRFCCTPSTEKRTCREYDLLAGFPLSSTVLRRVA